MKWVELALQGSRRAGMRHMSTEACSVKEVMKDIPRVARLSMEGFEFIRDEPKGHHAVRVMQSPWKEPCFVKTIGTGEWAKFYAEKENFTTRSALMCLGKDHAPVTYVGTEKKDGDIVYSLISGAIPKFFDLETFGGDPFFVDKKGITRLRVAPHASVITYGRIKTKLMAWMHNVLDPNTENPGISFEPGEYRVEGAPLDSPHYPIVMLDWEYGHPSREQYGDMCKETLHYVPELPIYYPDELAEDLAGEKGVSTVWAGFNKNNLEVLNRRPAKRAILEAVHDMPAEAWQCLFHQCVSSDYSPSYQHEWAMILNEFAMRLFIAKEAGALIREGRETVREDFSERLEEFSGHFLDILQRDRQEKRNDVSRLI